MVVFPNAKINIGLFVTDKRPDGFHNLETLFFPLKLCDALEIIPSEQLSFTCSGIQLDSNDNDNIVLNAYHLLKQDFDFPPVTIHLHKNIPFGAGLGGGSSDASFFINAIDELFSLNLSFEKKLFYASQIGSDCAFFLYNSLCFASGKGDQLQKIDANLLKNYKIVLIKPGYSVATPKAYQAIQPQKASYDLREIEQLPIELWKDHVLNDFEKPVFAMLPELEIIKQKLYKQGAIYASMSGSGSTLLGIFKEIPENIKESYPNSFVWAEK